MGKPFFDIDTDAKGEKGEKSAASEKPKEQKTESKPEAKQETKPETKEAKQASETKAPSKETPTNKPEPAKGPSFIPSSGSFERQEVREPLSKIKQKMGERLKQSQNTYASLTTFQEVDMSTIMEYRKVVAWPLRDSRSSSRSATA